jgi:hypothetical protein
MANSHGSHAESKNESAIKRFAWVGGFVAPFLVEVLIGSIIGSLPKPLPPMLYSVMSIATIVVSAGTGLLCVLWSYPRLKTPITLIYLPLMICAVWVFAFVFAH